MHKAILTITTTILIYTSTLAQVFQTEYFRFDDFPFIDQMDHADFNGDGLPDFLIGASNGGRLQVGINNGPNTAPTFSEITSLTSIKGATVADIDSDGDIDIIGYRLFSSAYAFINDGNASFELQELDISSYVSIAFEDMTGDGSLEMIVSAFDLSIYQIDPSTLALTEIYNLGFNNGTMDGIIVTDYNLDGDLDIIAATASGGVYLLEQIADLTFEESILYDGDFDVNSISVANLNNDGIVDLVLHSVDFSTGSILVSDSNATYVKEDLTETDVKNTLTILGDLNEDDKDEIITFEHITFNDPKMYIKEYQDALVDLDVIEDHFATYGGGVTDIDNDGDNDFYFFENNVSSPGVLYYLNDGISATNTLTNSKINIFPNPSSGIINLDVPDIKEFDARLYNLDGTLVLRKANSNWIDIQSIPNGTYLLQIEDLETGKNLTKKISVKH